MSKNATKARDNIFYIARSKASTFNDKLSSREGAAEELGIDRTRLANIELGNITSYPEEVNLMIDTYNAPELRNHFCSNECPLGKGKIHSLEISEFAKHTIAINYILSDKKTHYIRDTMIEVGFDDEISAEEKATLLQMIPDVNNMIKCLEGFLLWTEKYLVKKE